MKIITTTESLCPECLKKIPAHYLVENNNVYLSKTCPEHGPYRTLAWRDAALYEQWQRESIHAPKWKNGAPSSRGCPWDCGLCSEHEGGTCTAVLEVTYRCNMRCPVCFADSGKETFEPDQAKIREMYTALLEQNGPCSLQLSGGEPTVRDDLPALVQIGKELGFEHIQVNTNGLRIAADLPYLEQLKAAGADLIYLQFDGLDDEIYEKLRGRKMLEIKLKAIENCRAVNIGVLLVPTIVPQVNLAEIGRIIDFAREQMPLVKGIHFQPVSYFGRIPFSSPRDEDRATLADIVKEIEIQTRGEIKVENLIPRKRFDPHCSFSGLFYLHENGKFQAITRQNPAEKLRESGLTTVDDFVARANRYTKNYWQLGGDGGMPGREPEAGKLLVRIKNYTLSITGMPFQDVWNLDLGRLKGCCVHVISSRGQLVPLCAFHLTSTRGERLYRNG